MSEQLLPGPDQSTPEQEHVYHYYRGNEIPWYVRVIWLGFWIFTVVYILRYFFPAMQTELVLPP
ncbi:MAG TPA: hypothetical protein DIT89_02930 [Planctomycetaceae bacterium]|jgi:hypothetical protein|nr:hypothetical protein [Planctomycetaceae bacterium]